MTVSLVLQKQTVYDTSKCRLNLILQSGMMHENFPQGGTNEQLINNNTSNVSTRY